MRQAPTRLTHLLDYAAYAASVASSLSGKAATNHTHTGYRLLLGDLVAFQYRSLSFGGMLVASEEVAGSGDWSVTAPIPPPAEPPIEEGTTSDYLRGDKTWQPSSALPVSTAAAAALAAKADLVGGVVPSAQIPSLAITEYLGTIASQAAMLALSGQKGDWCNRSDGADKGMWIITGSDPAILGNWTKIDYPTSPVTEVNGQTGAITLGKADIGLGNVPNVDCTNASNLGSGTVADARLSGNVTLLGNGVLGTGSILRSAGTMVSTSGQTYTFPTSTAAIARTDAGQTFTGTQVFGTATFGQFNANASTGGVLLGQFGRLDLGGSDCALKRYGARDVQFGVTNDTNAYTLRCGVATGTNIASGDLILCPGTATGDAASGALRLRTAAAGASGTAAQTMVDTLVLASDGTVNFARLAATAAAAVSSTHKVPVKIGGTTYYLLASVA